MALERELETFQRNLPRLLNEGNRDKFAVIHGDDVRAVADTLEQALAAGYDLCRLEPFLVKQITDDEKPRFYSRNIRQCQS